MFTIPTVFTAKDQLGGAFSSMNAKVEAFASKSQKAFKAMTPVLSHANEELFSFAKAAAIAGAGIELLHFSYESAERYENAIAALAGASGLGSKGMEEFESKIKNVAVATQRGDSEIAELFKTIGALNPALYKTPELLASMTESAVTLGEALHVDLNTSASNLTQIMRAFKSPVEDSDKVINTMIATADHGGISFDQLSGSIKGIGPAAKLAGLSFEQTAAALATINQGANTGAESGMILQKIMIRLQGAHLGVKNGVFNLSDALDKLDKITGGNSVKQEKFLQKLGLTRGEVYNGTLALLQNKDAQAQLLNQITGTTAAHEKAEIQMSTLSGAVTRLKGAWDREINSSENSGTVMDKIRKGVIFLTDHLDTFLKVGGLVLGFFLAWKLSIMATNAYLFIYNAAIGVMGAISGVPAIGIGASTIALGAYNIALGIGTAATWLFNGAIAALEIVFSPIGIAIGLIVSIIVSLYRNWQSITDAFKDKGILSGILAIGNALGDSILYPLQKILELTAKFTGWDWASSAAKGIENMRIDAGLNVDTDEKGKPTSGKNVIDNRTTQHEAILQKQEQTNNASVALTIGNNSNNPVSVNNPNKVPIKMTSTHAGGGGGTW